MNEGLFNFVSSLGRFRCAIDKPEWLKTGQAIQLKMLFGQSVDSRIQNPVGSHYFLEK